MPFLMIEIRVPNELPYFFQFVVVKHVDEVGGNRRERNRIVIGRRADARPTQEQFMDEILEAVDTEFKCMFTFGDEPRVIDVEDDCYIFTAESLLFASDYLFYEHIAQLSSREYREQFDEDHEPISRRMYRMLKD